MAKGDYYFPLFYRRLLSSTIGWKDDEFGAYLRLLIYQFDNGSIPNDLDELILIAPSVKKNWKRISRKFKDDEKGGLINHVMDEIYQDIQKKKQKNSENGKKGGRKNRTVNRNETVGLPNGLKNETEVKAILINNNQESINKERETAHTFYSIEHCLTIALNDTRWTNANKASKEDLEQFNRVLEKRGIYDKNPMDYKNHFANWKASGKKDESFQEEIKTSGISAREQKGMDLLNS